ncbi:MAG: threonine--tRNA ligase [Deltaproteobacteria bacterium]|nr:threonine--tRNA ligase [Deltaproteobacteria bacterium]
MVKVSLQGGKEGSFSEGTLVLDAIKELDKELYKDAVAVKMDGVLRDLTVKLDGNASSIEVITSSTRDGLEVIRHSAAHIMAEAVQSLFPNVKIAIGPAIEDGFYYDFDTERPFTPEDIEKIEEKMRELVKANSRFSREDMPKADALKLFKDRGEIYKEELIKEINDKTVSVYKQGSFVDLCRGPHITASGRVKAFKLTATAGAYWRGNEKNKMLQRVYGTAFASKKELDDYLARLEEAKKRDHRRIGRELDLFSINDEIGPGLVLWHPNGAMVRHLIETFWKGEHIKGGYELINTPHVAKVDLWKTSGHWDFYKDNLYSPMDVEGQDYIVKPMNCPFHIQIYKSSLRSYRDLPVRYAELGTVCRYERSGVLHGLLRVRGFTQDDAHIYMTPSQLETEIKGVLKFTLYILRSFGFNDYDVYLSTRPEKYVGSLENWAKAEAALKAALESEGLKYEVDPGEGVFYGPKIDIKIKDVIGRSWQCSTIQVDFNLPERFGVTYRDEKGENAQAIMIHRALMGSLERFFGCLIEHYAGAFPFWLAPVQAIVLTVTDRNNEYAETVAKKLRAAGIRAEADLRNEKLGFKIREAELRKIPYMVVTGDSEAEKGLVTPRAKDKKELGAMAVDEFVSMLSKDNKPEGGGYL